MFKKKCAGPGLRDLVTENLWNEQIKKNMKQKIKSNFRISEKDKKLPDKNQEKNENQNLEIIKKIADELNIEPERIIEFSDKELSPSEGATVLFRKKLQLFIKIKK